MKPRRLVFETELPVPASQAYAWHSRPGAFARLMPPWQSHRVLGSSGPLAEGSEMSFEIGRRPFSLRWDARHEEVRPGVGFSDRQVRGPFRSWLHRRDLASSTKGGSRLVEEIEYELPAGPLASLGAAQWVSHQLQRTFAFRHRSLVSDLATQARYASMEPMRIAISGASGLIGSALAAFLSTAGHEILRLERTGQGAPGSVHWDPEHGVLELERLVGVDAVIHLAGENIAGGRWTAERKDAIRRSRTLGTAKLVESLSRLPVPPKHFLCASAIGAYGDSGLEEVDESSLRGEGFLSQVCEEWEEASEAARSFGARVAQLRFGVVLSPAGGALAKMLPPFLFGAGGRIGSGDQAMSWISIDDAVAAVLHTLATPSLEGPVNLVAPESCTNRQLTRQLGRVLKRPTLCPLPSLAVKALFGEMGESMLLASSRVKPTRLLDSGFEFGYAHLGRALRHCLGRPDATSREQPAEHGPNSATPAYQPVEN